jgi:hypothetical protein
MTRKIESDHDLIFCLSMISAQTLAFVAGKPVPVFADHALAGFITSTLRLINLFCRFTTIKYNHLYIVDFVQFIGA